MTLQELLGTDYREGMTVEEITTALATRTLVDESQVDTLVNNRTAAQKRLLDAANKKLADAQKQNNDVNTQNADLLARISTLEEGAKADKRDKEIAQNKASLIAQGYDEALATETATAMADNDMAKILLNQGKYLKAREEAMREEMLKGTKPPAAGGAAAGGSSRDFEKEIQEAQAAHDFARARALMREKAAAEQKK